MSTCARCGATFRCGMKDPGPDAGVAGPCWCTRLPPAVPVPRQEGAPLCWCPACLQAHIDAAAAPSPARQEGG